MVCESGIIPVARRSRMKKSAVSWLVVVSCAVVAVAAVLAQGLPGGQAQPAGQPPAAGAPQTQRGPMYVAPPRLAVREILDDLFQIAVGLDSTCMYVLVTRDKALVVDTQTVAEFEGKKIIDYVKSITDKPVVVVNTHPHRDHIAGNAPFGEVFASAPAIEDIKAAAARGNTPITYTLKPLKDGDTIDLGDRKIEVIAIGAHSPGSIAFLDQKAGYLFTGDEIDPGQVVGMNPEKIKLHHANMKKLYDKYYSKVTVIIPAHNGAPVTKRYIKYFMDLDAKIIAGTAPVVPIADGPNYDRWNNSMIRYREHFASVVYTKSVPTK
jgi:glyoxylase-like metal-dependent hydrolase (beta-lactamase superfamily II)